MNQNSTPLADALVQNADTHYVSFDVPGHKQTARFLTDYFGKRCVELDMNSRHSIDYLCQARGVIQQAQQLAAEAFGARSAFFIVGGTTASVQAMIMSACSPGDKIILPRNVHSSVVNAIILAGAVPVYINPTVHPTLGIALGMRLEDVAQCIACNSDAKAIFLNNPTYYGICSNLEEITALAHNCGMKVLVDEAHGTHFYFGRHFPKTAMACHADMAAVSMHKTGGSLTQSAILLSNDTIDPARVSNIINLTRTTSASYLLLASLDLARKRLVTEGPEQMEVTVRRVQQTRSRINSIGSYWAFSTDIIDADTVFDFDVSKLSVNTVNLGLAGIEVYSILRDRYNIQLEFGDICNILAITTMDDSDSMHEALIHALTDIQKNDSRKKQLKFAYEYITPQIVIPPRDAFYTPKEHLAIENSCGRISGESVMCYPPGIPLLAPGERITRQIIDHIQYAAEKGCTVSGLDKQNMIEVLKITETCHKTE